MADVTGFNPQLQSQAMQNAPYVEQLLNEVRRVSNILTNPTAHQICRDAISLLDTAWSIERQGGVTGGPEQQQQFAQYAQQYGGGAFMQRGFNTGGPAGPSTAGNR